MVTVLEAARRLGKDPARRSLTLVERLARRAGELVEVRRPADL